MDEQLYTTLIRSLRDKLISTGTLPVTDTARVTDTDTDTVTGSDTTIRKSSSATDNDGDNTYKSSSNKNQIRSFRREVIKRVFHLLDDNQSGNISVREVKDFLLSPELQLLDPNDEKSMKFVEMFIDQLDTNRDMTISVEELDNFLWPQGDDLDSNPAEVRELGPLLLHVRKAVARHVSSAAASGSDEAILHEFATLSKITPRKGKTLETRIFRKALSNLKLTELKGSPKLSLKEVDSVLRTIDCNNDSVISANEFKLWLFPDKANGREDELVKTLKDFIVKHFDGDVKLMFDEFKSGHSDSIQEADFKLKVKALEGDSLTRTVLNDIAARLVRESASRGTITLGGLTDLLGEQLFQSRAIDKGNESPPTTKLVDAAGETGDVEVSSTGKRPSASSTLTANPEIIMNATKDSTINPLVLKSNTDTLTNSNRELPLTSDIVTVPNMRRDIHGIDSEKTNRCENSVEENIAGKAAAEVVRSSSSFQPSSELATNLEDFADDTTSTSVGVDQSTVSKINSDFPPDFIAQQIITNSFNEMAPATQQESATASNSSDSPTEKIETINKSEVISSRENSIDNILDNDKLSFSLTEDSNTCMAAKSIQEQTDCDTLNAERMHSNIRLESVEVDNSQPISSDSTNILRATTLHETAVVVDECNDSTACRDMAIDLRVSSHQENNVSFYSKDTSGAAEGNTVGIQSVQKKEESAAADAENLDSTSRSDKKISISTELGKTISTPYTSENSAQPTVNGVVDASFAGKTSSNDNTSDRLETLDKSVKFNLQDRKTSEDSEMPHKSTEIETKSKIRDSDVNYSERKIDKERCQSEDQSQSLPLNISDFEPEEKQSPVEAIFAPTIAQSPTKAEGRAIADRNKNNNTARNSSNLRSSPNRLSQSTELLAKRFIPLSMSVLELPDMTHRLPLSESTATLDFVSYSHSLPSSPQKDARGSGDDAMYIGKGAAGFTPEQLIQLGYNKHLGRWRGFPFDTWTCCDTNDLLCPNSKKAKSFISSTSLHNKISMVCKSKSSERKIFDNRIRKSVENSEKIVFTPIRKSTSDFEQDEKIFLKDFFPKTTKKFLVKSKREDETDRNIDSAVEEERQFSRDDSAFSQSLMDIHKSLVLENELKRNANKKHGSVHRPLRRKQIVSEVQKLHDESKSLISSCSNQNMLMENKIDNPALSTPRKSMNKSEILPKPSVSQSQSKSLHPMKAKKGQPSMKRQENIPSHSVGSQKDVITNYFFPARESSFELASPSVLETADSEKHLIPEVPVTDYQILDRGTPCSSLVETSSLSKQLKNVKFDQIETTSIQEDINQDGSITNQDSKVHVDIIVRSESEFQNYDSGAYFVERDSAPHEVSCGMDNAGVTFSDDSAVAYGSRSVFRSYSNGSLNRKGLTADSPRAALLRSRSMSPRNKLRPSPIRTTSIDSMGAIQASSPRGLLVRKALCETRQELPWVPASYTPKSRHHSLSIDRDDVFIADIFDKDSTMNCTEIMKSGSPLRSTPRKKRILDLSAFVDMGETSAWWKKILLAKHKSEEYGYQTVQ